MRFRHIAFGLVVLLGACVPCGAGYWLVREPFLGGALLGGREMMGALLLLVGGFLVTLWGGVRFAGIGARI